MVSSTFATGLNPTGLASPALAALMLLPRRERTAAAETIVDGPGPHPTRRLR